MPEIRTTEERPLCPGGEYLFHLKEVEQKAMKAFQSEELVPKLIWKFVANRKSDTGEYYEVHLITQMRYGNEKATLTWLLDMLHPGISADWIKKNGLNTDRYTGKKYEALVKHTRSQDGSKTYATFAWIRPVRSAEEKADPFVSDEAGHVEVCSECGKNLSDTEEAACIKRWKGSLYFCREHALARIQAERISAAEEEDAFGVAA